MRSHSLGLTAGQMIARKKQQDKDWKIKNRELVNARARITNKLWREANPERFKEMRHLRYLRNREKEFERVKAWQVKNPERFKEYLAKSHAKTKEKQQHYKTAPRCISCEVILKDNQRMCNWCILSSKTIQVYVNN